MIRALMGSEQDPLCRALEAALTRWAREVWIHKNPGPFHQDHATMRELALALRFGQNRMGKGLLGIKQGRQRPTSDHYAWWAGKLWDLQ